MTAKTKPKRTASSVLFLRDVDPVKVRRLRALAAARGIPLRAFLLDGLLPLYEEMLTVAKFAGPPDGNDPRSKFGVERDLLDRYGIGPVDV